MSARLAATIPPARLARYDAAAATGGIDPIDLYRWSAAVSLAMFDDIGTVEVAMRSAMAGALTAEFGDDWFSRADLFDDDTARLIVQAWAQGRLPSVKGAAPDVIHGKLVASLMFGFWVKLLGRGDYAGKPPFKSRRYYDEALWKPALSKAFPHVGALERAKVEKAAHDVQLVRNRIAHHEHIIWGTPVFGQKNPTGTPRRISVGEAHSTTLRLAGYLSSDLESWLSAHSALPATIATCPLGTTTGLLI